MYGDAEEKALGVVRKFPGEYSRNDLARGLVAVYFNEGRLDIDYDGARTLIDGLVETGKLTESSPPDAWSRFWGVRLLYPGNSAPANQI